ncbi:hypothetical protein ACJX0J_022066, partial [Zea mays]
HEGLFASFCGTFITFQRYRVGWSSKITDITTLALNDRKYAFESYHRYSSPHFYWNKIIFRQKKLRLSYLPYMHGLYKGRPPHNHMLDRNAFNILCLPFDVVLLNNTDLSQKDMIKAYLYGHARERTTKNKATFYIFGSHGLPNNYRAASPNQTQV